MTAPAVKRRPKSSPPGEDRRAIYEQDCEFVRHHDRFKWSRVQMVSAIEGAVLYIILIQARGNHLGNFTLCFVATMAVAIMLMMVVNDARACKSHLTRMRSFEELQGSPFVPLTLRFPWAESPTKFVLIIVMFANVGLMGGAAIRLGWFSALGL